MSLTMEALADKSGLSQGYISVLEASKKTPTRKTINALADALGVAAADGLSAAGFLPGDDNQPDDLNEALAIANRLPAELRALVFRDVEELARLYEEWQSVLSQITDETVRMKASAEKLKQLQEREAVLRKRLAMPLEMRRRLQLISAELSDDVMVEELERS